MSSPVTPVPPSAPSSPSGALSARPSWTTGRTPNGFAALPAGRLGLLGGRLMRVLNARQQREVLALLDPGGSGGPVDVVEVGPGPGVLVGLVAAREGVRRVVGVEPSEQMRLLAVRATARHIAAGRVEIRPGSAEDTGLADGCADAVVAVNGVAIWPDLEAGIAELRRVLRPGGRLLLSWHGGREPTRAQRGLLLDDAALDRVGEALRARFDAVERVRARRCTVFDARLAAPTVG